MARVPREVMEAQLREFESHHVALLRSLSGLPTGESINAPLFDSAALSRVASAQGRLLSLLRALGDAAEPGRGTGASITAGLQPGMSFRSASAVPLGAMEELLDRLREVTETALDDARSGAASSSSAAAVAAAGSSGGAFLPRAHPVSLVGLEKPQAHFADPVDNSRGTRFVPRVLPRYAPAPVSAAAVEAEGAAASAEAQLPVMRVTPPTAALEAHPFAAAALCLGYPEGALAPPAGGPRALPPLDAAECTWVDTPAALEAMLAYMEGSAGAEGGGGGIGGGGEAALSHRLPPNGAGCSPVRELAVDLEHHSHRSFQGFTCLVQLSTWERDFLVDALALRAHLHGLNRLTLDPRVVKVMHGCDSDVVWLQRDFGVYLLNVFDTGQAARLLAYPSFGLAHLLKRHAGVTANKALALEDWRVRPLPPAMQRYAQEDTHWLLAVYDRLKVELATASVGATLVRCAARPHWRPVPSLLASALARSAEKTLAVYVKEPFRADGYAALMVRMAGSGGEGGGGSAPPPAAAPSTPFSRVFSVMYEWRDRVAREEDESVAFVLPSKLLMRLAETRPASVDGLLRACQPLPPLVRRDMKALVALIAGAVAGRVGGGGSGGGGGGSSSGGGGGGGVAPAPVQKSALAAGERPAAAAAAGLPPASAVRERLPATAENVPSLTEILGVVVPPGGWLQPPAPSAAPPRATITVRDLSCCEGGGSTPPPPRFSAAPAWGGRGLEPGAAAAAEVHASLLGLSWQTLLGVRTWRRREAGDPPSAPAAPAAPDAPPPIAQADEGEMVDGVLQLPSDDLASLLGAAVAGAGASAGASVGAGGAAPAAVAADGVRSLAQRFSNKKYRAGAEKPAEGVASAPPAAPSAASPPAAFTYSDPEGVGLEATEAPGEAVDAARAAAGAAWADVSRRGAKSSRGGRGGRGGGGANPFILGSGPKRGRGGKP